MPQIDVSELMVDPDFCETVTVIRQTQSVSDGGLATPGTTTTFSITAVVTAVQGDLVRQPEAEYAKNDILVHSQAQLRGVTSGNYPDVVVWSGNNYIVKRSNNWSHFGVGFYSAVCTLTDVAETP